ncbi:ABC1 kinase family protein [Polyangium mundeleinium]|uniref:AarF/UbiB family protein n=1 Tax=Polyangium mundeleinium TaxID=2995306 RepID=A0ABT5F2N5_9BACT|nr:AarF/UbiB family protein [Polyangium mundeleinium]MDC0747879.1 AarF/UbiB family protein [Polyangium mundeleinium]
MRFRLLFIFGLCLRVVWHLVMARIPKPAGPGGKYTPVRLAQLVRESAERLGGLWIKAAQIMAMRRDIFPKIFCDELAALHDRAVGFPGDVAVKIIEEELNCSIKDVFREFDVVPLAAASIGQVHVARLRDTGKKVAIKVQRPGIIESFRKDLAIFAGYLNFLKLIRFMPWGRWDEMFQKLQGTLADEVDYRIEAAAMRRMRRTLKQDKVYVPRVYSRYCSKRVLVMEFIDGVLMSDYIHALVDEPKRAKQWRKENNVKTKKVGERLFLNFLMQVLEDNLAHGDLHPGNIMLLKNSRIAFIDFGSVSVLDKGFLEKYRIAIRYVALRDFSKFFDVNLTMVPGVPNVDIEQMRSQVVRELEGWEALTDVKGIPYEQRALTGANVRLAAVFGTYKVPPNWGLLRLMRSSAALDASLKFLIPEVNFFKLTRRHFQRLNQRRAKFVTSKRSREALANTVGDLMRLPAGVGENLIFQGELIRKRAMSFQAQISKAAEVGKALLTTALNIGLIATVLVVARYLSKQHDVGTKAIAQLPLRDVFSSMPHVSPGVWIVVILLSLYLLQNLRKLVRVLGVTGVGSNPFL